MTQGKLVLTLLTNNDSVPFNQPDNIVETLHGTYLVERENLEDFTVCEKQIKHSLIPSLLLPCISHCYGKKPKKVEIIYEQ